MSRPSLRRTAARRHMGYPIQRIPRPAGEDVQGRAADRARLLEKVAIGLAHEGKNPLHNMVLHLQLMSEKLASPELKGGSPIEKHLSAMRDGIGRVDALLRSFGDFAAPQHLTPDLGAALKRAFVLFAYEARRASVQMASSSPATLKMSSESQYTCGLIAHAPARSIPHHHVRGRI